MGMYLPYMMDDQSSQGETIFQKNGSTFFLRPFDTTYGILENIKGVSLFVNKTLFTFLSIEINYNTKPMNNQQNLREAVEKLKHSNITQARDEASDLWNWCQTTRGSPSKEHCAVVAGFPP